MTVPSTAVGAHPFLGQLVHWVDYRNACVPMLVRRKHSPTLLDLLPVIPGSQERRSNFSSTSSVMASGSWHFAEGCSESGELGAQESPQSR